MQEQICLCFKYFLYLCMLGKLYYNGLEEDKHSA